MIRRLLFAISLLWICLMAMPQPALAYNLFGGVDCSNAANSTVCTEKNKSGNPISGPDGILLKITNIVAYIGGAAAIIVLLVGSIKFVTAGSDTSKGGRVDADVENARRAVAGALIGLAIIVLGKVLITYLVQKL